MAQLKFGTDGWRGLIADDFTFENVRRVAHSLGKALPDQSHVVIGYDHRFLSADFAHEAGSVLAVQKHKITMLSHPVTSPEVSLALQKLRCAAGVMITASHNPPLYNGFKVKLPPGCSADAAFTRQLEGLIPSYAARASEVPAFRTYSPDNDYVAFLMSKLEKRYWRNGRFPLAADSMYGYGGKLLEKIFGKMGIKGIVIHAEKNPLFGGCSPEPIEKNLGPLKEAVVKGKAPLGIAVDGDGDRLGIVDEKGRYLTPHQVFPLILLHLLENRHLTGRVVQSVSLGYLSERIAKKFGLDLVFVPVGFKYVVEKMREGKVLLGGEESGGFGVGHWGFERDGLLSGLLLAELVLCKRKPLSVLCKEMEASFGQSVFMRQDCPVRSAVSNKKAWAEFLVTRLPKKIAGIKIRRCETLDGLKIILEDESWLLLRPSGTEPLMRIYAESPSQQTTAQLLNKAQDFSSIKAPQQPSE